MSHFILKCLLSFSRLIRYERVGCGREGGGGGWKVIVGSKTSIITCRITRTAFSKLTSGKLKKFLGASSLPPFASTISFRLFLSSLVICSGFFHR